MIGWLGVNVHEFVKMITLVEGYLLKNSEKKQLFPSLLVFSMAASSKYYLYQPTLCLVSKKCYEKELCFSYLDLSS